MPSENLNVAKLLNILAWIVLGVGVVGATLSLCFLPAYHWSTVLPPVITIFAVLVVFVVLNVLARVLRTVTYLYQLAWEQFAELGNDIDELDGKNDGNVGPQCPYCGALIQEGETVCSRCHKPLGEAAEAEERSR